MSANLPGGTAPNTLSRRYLATIGIVAIVVLGLGIVAKQAINGHETGPATTPAEPFSLQRLSQENQLLDISAFIDERVTAAAPLIVRVPSVDAAGIRWGARDTIITTSALRPVIVVLPEAPDTVRPAPITNDLRSAREWLLVVGRDKDGRVISWQGISGGLTTGTCGRDTISRYVMGFAPGAAFAGAGIFDLAGRIQGMTVNCRNEFVPIPRDEMLRLLADTASVNAPTPDSAGSRGPLKRGSSRARSSPRRK